MKDQETLMREERAQELMEIDLKPEDYPVSMEGAILHQYKLIARLEQILYKYKQVAHDLERLKQ